MIISATQYNAESDISVRMHWTESNDPFVMRLSLGTSVHLSVADAKRLLLELTAVLDEWEKLESDE
jgi:glycine cleavage system regulatory protein